MIRLIIQFVFCVLLLSCSFSNTSRLKYSQNNSSKAASKELSKTSSTSNSGVIDILLPFTYRLFEGDNPTKKMNKNWLDLYSVDGEYFIDNANYSIKKDKDECSGLDTRTIESKRKTLLFINNANLLKGKIQSLQISKDILFPDEQITFDFANKHYSLRAEGTQRDSTCSQYCLSDYKIFIKVNDGPEQLILSADHFEDSIYSLLFVGDIDGDGKLDFVFDTHQNYEVKSASLFLSSKVDSGEVVKMVAEININFDC